jgi:hypothetical protein
LTNENALSKLRTEEGKINYFGRRRKRRKHRYICPYIQGVKVCLGKNFV